MNQTETFIRLLYIDLFCGAGGTTTGVEAARVNGEKCAKVIACVNHDAHAIASHAANHPDALHFTEDIRTLDIAPLAAHLAMAKAQWPNAKVVLWASLECTNFSNAKGGLPRDADSRTLAEHLFRYIDALNPDYIQIENVEEFMSWGDLDSKGHPISRDRGRCFISWINSVEKYGYYFDYKILNAADFGAYTSRKRFFGLFSRKWLPSAFPHATHRKSGNEGYEIFGEEMFKKWNPVKEVLDLDDEGTSIFTRKRPLCEKTLERIYAGLIKFVAGGAAQNPLELAKVQFISKHFSGQPGSKNTSIDKPTGTLTCKCNQSFVTVFYGNGFNRSIEEPAPTQTAKDSVDIAIFEDDSPMTVKIKEFMALYNITDIRMRMLKVIELKRIMGFPSDYVLIGTQSEQKKFIGNAVEVNMAKTLAETLAKCIV